LPPFGKAIVNARKRPDGAETFEALRRSGVLVPKAAEIPDSPSAKEPLAKDAE